MKDLLKKVVVWKLRVLSRLYLKLYKPTVVAVTGNVGKTSTKEAIAAVLMSKFKVRYSKGNLNNEFGVPLTILGDWSEDYYQWGNSLFFWPGVLWKGFFGLFFQRHYPKVLILEYGADAPGDISKMVNLCPPKIGVVTAVGEIPVHVEYFQGKEDVAREKSKLISSLPLDGFAILNHDDPLVFGMKDRTKAHIKTFGVNENASVYFGSSEFVYSDQMKVKGIKFRLHQGKNAYVPVIVEGSLGISQSYAASAAACVALAMGMNLVEIAEALGKNYHGPKGRLKILKGIKNSTIIDDTYNAAPSSTHLALDVLKNVDVPRPLGLGISTARRLVVLGDMLELGKYTVQAHQEIGNLAARSVGEGGILVFVGSRMKFAADSALRSLGEVGGGNIFHFETSDEAKKKVEDLIMDGDVILVKGSQGVRMEKIVEEIMGEPLRKEELLVRQTGIWKNK